MILKAVNIVCEAFEVETDKSDKPMVAHSLRVFVRMQRYPEAFLIVALLHDVVEDTDWTLDDLKKEGFSETVIEAVDAITRREYTMGKEDYPQYLERVKANLIARTIKLAADLPDNMSPERHEKLSIDESVRLMKKYKKAMEFLKYEDD